MLLIAISLLLIRAGSSYCFFFGGGGGVINLTENRVPKTQAVEG